MFYPWATPSSPSSTHHFSSYGVKTVRTVSPWLISSEQGKEPFVPGHKRYFLEIILHIGALTVHSEADTKERTQIWSNLRDLCPQPQEKLIMYYTFTLAGCILFSGVAGNQPRNGLKPRALKLSTNTFTMWDSDLDTMQQQLISYLEFPGDTDPGLHWSE